MIWRKIRKLVAVSIFLVLIGGTYFFVMSKMIAQMKEKKNHIQETVAIQEYQRERTGELQEMKSDFEMAEASEEKIASFLDKEHAVDFIQEIEKLSERTNSRVEIEVVPVETPAKNKNAKNSGDSIMGALPSKDYLQFNIKTAGTFLGLVKFINQLENSQYYLDVVSIQVDANPDAGKERQEPERASLNPFASRSGADNSDEEKDVQNEEEVIAAIGVVVYTQNQ